MRSLFLILLLANLLLFASQFDDVRNLFSGTQTTKQEPPINAERLRIARDPPARSRAPSPSSTDDAAQPNNGMNSR